MTLPSIIKKMGNITGENRVYIEDYAYSYLNALGEKSNGLPVRAALYGHAFTREEKRFFLIYGASHVVEELQDGRTQEQIQRDFFPEYSLIGYVNIYPGRRLSEKDGYFVFYEANEPMQNYLVSCYKKRQKQTRQEALTAQAEEEKKESRAVFQKRIFPGTFFDRVGEVLKKALLFFLTVLAAASVLTISNYAGMHDFTRMAAQAIQETEKSG